MDYAIDILADETHVQFFGEIDLATAAEMLDTLTQTILDSTGDRVVVDLAEVPLLDATAVGALVAARTIASHRGRTLVIANPRRMVRQVLGVTGALRVLMDSEPRD
jgi:anti-anti-sigma factor